MLGFILGSMLGGTFGFAAMCLVQAGRDDDRFDLPSPKQPDDNEKSR